MFIHTNKKRRVVWEEMDRREILFSVTETSRRWGTQRSGWMDGWMEEGEHAGRWEIEFERGELLSIKESWPRAAVPAVAKSGQKAIDYTPWRTPGVMADGGREEGEGRIESDGGCWHEHNGEICKVSGKWIVCSGKDPDLINTSLCLFFISLVFMLNHSSSFLVMTQK